MNVLFVGDIFGKPGRFVIQNYLSKIIEELGIDVCIANGENVAGGKGITEKTARKLFDGGIDVFTGGNHLWDKKDSLNYIAEEKRILKPINYPSAALGARYFIKTISENNKLAIVSLIGQAFIASVDSPLFSLEKILPELYEHTNKILVDFHAEATAEKRALGLYFDGKISAFLGTHTHIQTADEEILPNGTAYITDVGMTGPHDSVIGIKKEIIFEKIKTGMPQRYETAQNGLQLNAVFLKIDDESGKALEIKRIKRKYND
ncbi:MAG: TIGR00282 family metallophosphoesterase [Candidatus Cloacimonadota bacterium]|nr:MAG: TIGR00282 family metallophosphoesterase [Candidatus Cloacimonadota bacterium]